MVAAADEEYVIEIKGLVNTVGTNTILHRDLDLQVRRDEVMSLVGGSGSGKTQLVRVILGLKRPTAGVVRVFGVSWEDSSAKKVRDARRRMGMLFQNGALYSALTVYDNVAFRCHENNVPEEMVEQEVRRLLRFVNLEEAIEMMPAQLSGGMRIRVGIARALAGRPDIVLLDEPTAGLDPPTARAICELGIKMRDLRDVSSIFVTHGLDNVRFLTSTYTCIDGKGEAVFMKEADRLCLINTKIMMLREGRIIFYGTDEELFKLEDPYIRDFLLVE